MMATKRRTTTTDRAPDTAPSNAAPSAETLGGLIDALLPVLVDRLAETGLGEIEVERDGATIRVRAESGATAPSLAPATNAATHGGAPRGSAAPSLVPHGDERPRPARHAVHSSAVGYLTLSKEIHVGAKVAKGALVATVDVLGIATEVRADQGGIVAALKVASGDPVEYGQELFILESVGEAGRDANRGDSST